MACDKLYFEDHRPIRILLVEDDEDDYLLVKVLLSKMEGKSFQLDWIASYQEALDAAEKETYDVYLIDYLLGEYDGLELIEELLGRGCRAPIILLTGMGDYEVDMKAMERGAADYITKELLSGPLLERSIRYAISNKRNEEALRRSREQLKRFSHRLLTVQEKERKRLASRIHDDISSTLSAVKYQFERILQRLAPADHQDFAAVVKTLQETIEESRGIMIDLRPSILDDLGINAAIEWLCRDFSKKYPDIQTEKAVLLDDLEIADPMRTILFRIIQEALHNTGRHSGAQSVRVCLERTGDHLELTVEDDGRGFEIDEALPAESGKDRIGVGLHAMRERTELSGGTFEVTAVPGKGTRIHSSWPLDAILPP